MQREVTWSAHPAKARMLGTNPKGPQPRKPGGAGFPLRTSPAERGCWSTEILHLRRIRLPSASFQPVWPRILWEACLGSLVLSQLSPNSNSGPPSSAKPGPALLPYCPLTLQLWPPQSLWDFSKGPNSPISCFPNTSPLMPYLRAQSSPSPAAGLPGFKLHDRVCVLCDVRQILTSLSLSVLISEVGSVIVPTS